MQIAAQWLKESGMTIDRVARLEGDAAIYLQCNAWID